MLSIEEARARVARGAAHLDTIDPTWHERIDVGTLDLSKSCRCICGQLAEGERWDGSEIVRAFFRVKGTDDSYNVGILANGSTEYSLLQDAWVEAIADRRLKAQPTDRAVWAETPEAVQL